MVDSKLPFNRALLWILFSILSISGLAFMGWQYYLHMREHRLHDDQYYIVAIVQRTPQPEALKTSYLAELLDLSFDRPANLYQFSVQEAECKLLACPLIQAASVKKILPGALYINYQMRVPVAYLGDYHNAALDHEGMIFPFRPFFTPKHLPTICLGLDKGTVCWGDCFKENASLKLAFAVLEQFNQIKQDRFYVKQLDISQVQADSYGQRQMIIVLEERDREWADLSSQGSKIFLRLSVDHYVQDLARFYALQTFVDRGGMILPETSGQSLKNQTIIIDLRIPSLAFIKKEV